MTRRHWTCALQVSALKEITLGDWRVNVVAIYQKCMRCPTPSSPSPHHHHHCTSQTGWPWDICSFPTSKKTFRLCSSSCCLRYIMPRCCLPFNDLEERRANSNTHTSSAPSTAVVVVFNNTCEFSFAGVRPHLLLLRAVPSVCGLTWRSSEVLPVFSSSYTWWLSASSRFSYSLLSSGEPTCVKSFSQAKSWYWLGNIIYYIT